jgi:DNA-binding response OmpR family regulator
MQKILLVEDDVNICNIIKKYFETHKFQVYVKFSGEDALSFISNNEVDMVILDIMLPGITGMEVCKKIRENYIIPIIMLTAKGEVIDKIEGLKIGADDYVVKPFDPNELIARAQAILRRTNFTHKQLSFNKDLNLLKFQDLIINKEANEVFLNDKKIIVPRREFQLLEFLTSNTNKTFNRNQLIEFIWGYDFDGEDRVIDLYIERLRKRLKIDKEVNWKIKTVWGIGYKFEVGN